MQHQILDTYTKDPYTNLAREAYLFDRAPKGCILYLWQNENTVVIGKHQNAWQECRVSLLESEGGRLARRSSGGGAVYHDLGNLNFTFIAPRALYDVTRQLGVIQRAAAAYGIATMFTGRNDLVITQSGAKFSGNAFRIGAKTAMHHGTILIDVDMAKLARYLAPSRQKLSAKGVQSVRARVMNLKECNGEITIDGMREALKEAFAAEYGAAVQMPAIDAAALAPLREKYAAWEWRLGSTPDFDCALSTRFDWGEIQLHFQLTHGQVSACNVYSDAIDEALIDRIAPALLGTRFAPAALAQRLYTLGGEQAAQLAAWVESSEL